ncbi:MAG: SH3 domain-containing protein [Chloroflexi bacterium]|nr:SH3 domain-containing protein [Chloroflexota bacterium]
MHDDYSWLEEPQPDASPSSASESANQRRGLRRFLPRLRRRKLASVAAEQPGATDLLGSQSERPLTELDQRLQALRARSMGGEPKEEWQELYDVDQVLTSPVLQEKPGGIISAVALSQGQQAQVDLLTEIVGGQSEPDKTPAKRRLVRRAAQSLLSIPRLLVSALLLLFVALPYVSSNYAPGALPPDEFAADDPQAAAFYTALDSIAVGDDVLVAVEYGLGAAAELDALTDLALRHIFARGGRAVLATSNPIAFVHAKNIVDDIRDRAAQAGMRLMDGHDYLLLRFLPGGALGLRELSENFADVVRMSKRDAPTSMPIHSLADMSLLLLIADSADDMRNWVEQALPEAGNARLYAAISLAAEPLARAYVEDIDRFAGLVVGMRAAYTYGAMLDASFGVDVQPPMHNTVVPVEATPTATIISTRTQPTAPAPTGVGAGAGDLGARNVAQAAPSLTPMPTTTPRPTNTPSPQPTNTPTVTATTAMIRIVEVTSPQSPVNIRVGPSTAQATLGLAYTGDTLEVLDTNADKSWYKILMSNGWEGWISAIVVSEGIVPESALNSDDSASSTRERSVMSLFYPRRYGNIEPRFSQANQIPSSTRGAIVQLRERGGEAQRLQALTMGTLAAVLAIALGNLVAAIGALIRRG